MNPEEICHNFRIVQSERVVAQEQWDDITDLVTPYRGRFFETNQSEDSIQWYRARKNYDSTASNAHGTLTSNLYGALTSPNVQWFTLRYRDEKLNKNTKAAEWLEGCATRINYELLDSNFGLEINQVYADICGFGTGVITLEQMSGSVWSGLNFSAVPLKEAYFKDDAIGRVAYFYRHIKWTPVKILSMFGKDTPQMVVDRFKDGDTTKIDVLFAIYPRSNRVIPVGERVANSRRPWEYSYILLDEQEQIGKIGGYYEMPAFVGRWLKTSESQWGYSPAHLAMGDIQSLNEARKMQLKMAEKLIDPPIFADERAIIADLDMSAASLNVVADIDRIKVFQSGGSIPVSDHMIQQLQEAVKDYFYVDQLTFPRPQGTPMSATEVMVRQDNMARFMAPTMARIQNDVLTPIISRSFRIMARENQFPPPPDVVVQSDAQFDIQYMGSLSRAQNSDKAASVERLVSNVANLAPVFPQALDVIDADAFVRELARDLNVPASTLRGDREVKALRLQRADEQKQMQDAVIAEQQGKAAQAVGEGEQALEQRGT
jgi:hypothetical protein